MQPRDAELFTYHFYPSSFIFFGGGALAYHLSKKKVEPHYFFAIIAIIVLSFTTTKMPFWHLLFISMAIPVLFHYTAKNPIDRAIGELSYPAYILHFPVLLFLRPFTQTHPQYFNFISLGSWVAMGSCLIGLLIYFVVEKKINVYRRSKTFLKQESPPMGKKQHYLLMGLLSLFFLFPIATIAYIYSSQGPSTTPYNLTDDNWTNGVHKKDVAFFISNSWSNAKQYQVGKEIKFSNDDVREIIKVEKTDQYLNIYLTGDVLDSETFGFPNKFKVIE